MTEAQALALSDHPYVKRVEENAVLRLDASNPQTGLLTPTYGNNSLWGLDRVDQKGPGAPRVDSEYAWCADGAPVWIYVMDTGVNPSHTVEFGSRVDTAPDFDAYLQSVGQAMGDPAECWDTSLRDDARCGHGTAVASIAAGDTFGVAKTARIVDLRTSDPIWGMPLSRLLAALEFLNTQDQRTGDKVLNISSSSLTTWDSREHTVKELIGQLTDGAKNFKVVLSAGNDDSDAWWYVPASAERAITVGAINKDSDTKWSASNWGATVDFWAPGQFVESASPLLPPWVDPWRYRSQSYTCNDSGYVDTCTSGTSFAAPHVSGIVARYLHRHPGARRDDVLSALESISATYSGATVTDRTAVTRRVAVFNECP
ncbi:MAG TPA: S8 family serine peptidase [Thermoanaerobaculia bacterium]|nr:S8 family serine peptidase [Thermoanaerobaculia bacterium]